MIAVIRRVLSSKPTTILAWLSSRLGLNTDQTSLSLSGARIQARCRWLLVLVTPVVVDATLRTYLLSLVVSVHDLRR
jgi:hypothetical protein